MGPVRRVLSTQWPGPQAHHRSAVERMRVVGPFDTSVGASGDAASRRETPTMRALVLSEHPLRRWRGEFESGRRSTGLPYGVDALERRGYELEGQARASSKLATKVRDVVEHRLGYPVERALRAMPRAARADVVIALLEAQGIAPAMLKRRGLSPYAATPLVIWSCWLADDLRNLPLDERRARARALDRVDLIVHLSRSETEVFTDLGFSPDRLFPMTYGVAAEFYTPPTGERDLGIVAIGQDRGRDYATLFRAVADTELRLDVVCRTDNLRGLEIPPNVTVHPPVGHRDYRELLRRASVVAVPTRDLAYPTGSSVALEASSCGACVIATDTSAMREYLRHNDTAVLVPVGDADAWRHALRRVTSDSALRNRIGKQARASVSTTFNTNNMWFEIDDEMRERGIVVGRT